MDPSTMSFEDFLFNGRYHIIGAVLFLVFVGAFLREVIRELVMVYSERRSTVRNVAFGPMFHDALVGQTMTDGGEPVDEEDKGETKTP